MKLCRRGCPTKGVCIIWTNSQQPTAIRWLLMGLAFVLCASGINQVQAGDENHPQPLGTITTTANRTFYFPGNLEGFFNTPPPLPPAFDSIGPEDDNRLTQAEACQILANHKPTDNNPFTPKCELNNYSAAPGFPSSGGADWAGNGCGSGPVGNWVAEAVLAGAYHDQFSGNLDHPLQGYPKVSFKNACNVHDGCYTVVGPKDRCDSAFGTALTNICNGLSGSNAQTCQTFASEYLNGVETAGNIPYASGQIQAKCAAWGNAMKKNECPE